MYVGQRVNGRQADALALVLRREDALRPRQTDGAHHARPSSGSASLRAQKIASQRSIRDSAFVIFEFWWVQHHENLQGALTQIRIFNSLTVLISAISGVCLSYITMPACQHRGMQGAAGSSASWELDPAVSDHKALSTQQKHHQRALYDESPVWH